MRRQRHVEEHVNHERWLISYADFITLLFAFFVVLFASAHRDNREVKIVAQAIHTGFEEMGTFATSSSNIKDLHAKSGLTVSAGDASLATPSVPLTKTGEPVKTAATAVDVAELRRQLEAAIGKELKNHEIEMRVTPEGFVISLRDLGFFNSGQAVLLPGADEKIERIAKVLLQHGLDLRVEGHSDNQPIHTGQFRSNWELSTARAVAVLLLLVDKGGMDPTKMSVAGYGEFRPIADNFTPEGRQMNRRVDLDVVAPVPPGAS